VTLPINVKDSFGALVEFVSIYTDLVMGHVASGPCALGSNIAISVMFSHGLTTCFMSLGAFIVICSDFLPF